MIFFRTSTRHVVEIRSFSSRYSQLRPRVNFPLSIIRQQVADWWAVKNQWPRCACVTRKRGVCTDAVRTSENYMHSVAKNVRVCATSKRRPVKKCRVRSSGRGSSLRFAFCFNYPFVRSLPGNERGRRKNRARRHKVTHTHTDTLTHTHTSKSRTWNGHFSQAERALSSVTTTASTNV